MTQTTAVLLGLIVLAVAVVVLLVARRRRYVGALRKRGWTFHSTPELSWVLDHAAPPFGLGFSRSVDESVSGVTRSGVPFHVFEYAGRGGGPRFDERMASLRLPLALPDVFVSQGTSRTGVQLPLVPVDPACLVRTASPELAAALFTPGVRAAVNTFGRTAGRLDLSVDGDHLVAVGAPKDPDALERYLEALAGVATALDLAALAPFAVTPAAPRFGFYGRPDWVLVDRDDSALDRYDLSTEGTEHRAEQVLRGANDGLPLEAFVHRWQTSRSETSTDSDGHRTTRTVTTEHSENVVGVWLPFAVPRLSLNSGRWVDRPITFELEQFNRSFTVRSSERRFAYDVIHPRMMEFLLEVQPPPFGIEGQLMRFAPTAHDSLEIGRCADFAHEFFRRVPSFVWANLGAAPPALRSSPSLPIALGSTRAWEPGRE